MFTKYAWTLARVAYSEGSLDWRNCRSASGDPGEITKSHWEISQDSEIPIYQGQEPASSLNVPYFKSKWGSDTKLNSMSIVKTVRGILDPNPSDVSLKLVLGSNCKGVTLENPQDRNTKLRQHYTVECFDEQREWENGWRTAEALHQEVAELHLINIQRIDFKGRKNSKMNFMGKPKRIWIPLNACDSVSLIVPINYNTLALQIPANIKIS